MKIINNKNLTEYLEDIKLNILISEPLLGYIISNLNIVEDNKIDTLCIYFNNQLFKYEIKYNFKFLLTLKSFYEIQAVFKHELYHLIFKHHFRAINYEKEYGYIDMKTANIAMDISINQLIENLPYTALNYINYNLERDQDFETYYKILHNDNKSDSQGKNKNGTSKSNSKGKSLTDSFSDNNNNDNLSKEKIENDNKSDSNEISENNKQNFAGMNEDKSANSKIENHNELIESVKNEDMEIIEKITEDMVKEAIKQTANKYGNGGYVEELKRLWNKETKVHWTKVLKNFIEKTILSNEKEETWMKINKRFEYLKGKRKIYSPKIMVAIDTSGSISEEKIYTFLNEIKHIVKFTDIEVIYFHSEVYNHFINLDKTKINKIQRGGTFLQSPIEFAKNKKFKNLIIMTDGYGESNLELKNIKTIFIKDTLTDIYSPKIKIIKGNNIFNTYTTLKVSNK